MPRFSFLMACCFIVAGCSNAEYHVDAGPAPDAGGPMGLLTIETHDALTLAFGRSETLSARYTESGAPVAGVTIRFALEGRAHDATLAAVTAETNAEGRVSTMLIGGSTPSVFRVRVSADRAAPVYVDVSVGNMGFGGLRVGAIYEGAREGGTRRVIDVYSEMSCGDEAPPLPDREITLEPDTETEAYFPVLAAGLRYAVIGRVLGSAGAVLATACTEIEVLRDMEVRCDLEFRDRPLVVDGAYDVTLGIVPGSSGELAVELARTAGTAPVETSGSGAGLYLDALEDELRARGSVAAEALATERLSGGPDASLQGELEAAEEGPSAGLDAFLARLASRLSAITLTGPLAMDASHGLEGAFGTLALSLGPTAEPDTAPLSIDTSAAGLDLGPDATWSEGRDDGHLRLDSLTLSLPLGTLASAAIDAEASALGEDGAALLAEGAGCEVLASWIAERPSLAPECDADCAASACGRALGSILEAVRAALASADETHAEATLSGTITLVDADADLVVDRMTGDALEGSWSSSLGAGDPLTGELAATRAGIDPSGTEP